MASSLRVNAIVPASGTNVAIGTAGGTITYNASVYGVSTFSSGIVVSAGTTAAPAISPSGDSNTGIFFPSADTVCIGEGGTEVIRVDSSSNVGIKTTSTSGFNGACDDIVVSGGADVGMTFYSTSTTGSGNIAFTRGSVSGNTHGAINYNHTSDYMAFQTNLGEKMRIDSSGRVTKPFQPYFYARTGRTGADGYTNNPYRFEDVLHNVGGHFVTSGTGAYERFVAPVAGIYCFQSSPGYKQTSVDWNVRIRINGTEYAEIGRFIGSPSSHSTIGGSVTLKLSANDYVDLNNGGSAYHINTTLNFFCGYLLG
jgi:hypothetical protein